MLERSCVRRLLKIWGNADIEIEDLECELKVLEGIRDSYAKNAGKLWGLGKAEDDMGKVERDMEHIRGKLLMLKAVKRKVGRELERLGEAKPFWREVVEMRHRNGGLSWELTSERMHYSAGYLKNVYSKVISRLCRIL